MKVQSTLRLLFTKGYYAGIVLQSRDPLDSVQRALGTRRHMPTGNILGSFRRYFLWGFGTAQRERAAINRMEGFMRYSSFVVAFCYWWQSRSAVVLMRFLLLCALSCAEVAMGAPYSFQGLGYLANSPAYDEAFAVSGDGHVATGYNYSGTDRQAVRWQNGTTTGMGDLAGGHYASIGYGVNADGSVIVGQASAPSSFQAFRWQGGVMQGLGTIGNFGGGSQAFGVSADGSVVVGFSSAAGAQSQEAFYWKNGAMVGLGYLPGPQSYSGANAVSSDGAVVVGLSFVTAGTEAFRWTSATGMVGLGDIPGGSFDSTAMAVNANGSVIVGFGFNAKGRTPFRWENGTLTDLGDVPGGPIQCIAYGVSADGKVIVGGGNYLPTTLHGAFIWDPVNGMRNLHDVMVNDLGLDLSGWSIYNAYGISADGLTVVGNGLNPQGNREAWIATIPEPTAVGLLLLPAMAFLWRHHLPRAR